MTHLRGDERSLFVRKMFGRIAQSYDRINRIMTFNQDLKWRRTAAGLFDFSTKALLLDLGTGTGDMIVEIQRVLPQAIIVGVDFTPEMIKLGRNREDISHTSWVIADVHHLPFPASTFDGTISAFLMRNLPNIDPVLQEQNRLLSEGGQLICLETTPTFQKPFRPIIHFYIHRIIPWFGRLFSQDHEAYNYLARSAEEFIPAECFAERIQLAGFSDIKFIRRMLGTIAIHKAMKA